MNKSLILVFIVILITVFLLSGCWNYQEIDRLAIVSGLAVDKSNKGDKFLLTAEIIDLQGSLTEENIKSKRIEAEGDTIFDGIRNMIKISAKKLYWSHAKAIIISQDVAKEGIIPILDWISRDQEPRMTVNIFVSREKTARELLSQQSITTEIRAFEMGYMLIGNHDLSKAPNVDANELMNIISGKGISVSTPTIGVTLNEGKKTAELSGTAIFKKDKLIGFLDGEDTKFFLFVRDKIQGGLLIVNENEEYLKDKITLEIFKNKTKLKPIYSNGKLMMNIDVNTEVSIAEEDTDRDYMKKKGRELLKKEVEKSLEENITKVIKKVQTDFNSDIFGFGRIVRNEMPSLWKRIEDEWDEIFNQLEIKVNAEINIRNSGLTSKPVQVGE